MSYFVSILVLQFICEPKLIDILCMELIQKLSSDCFETLQVLRPWSDDMHMFWHNPQIIFVAFFTKRT